MLIVDRDSCDSPVEDSDTTLSERAARRASCCCRAFVRCRFCSWVVHGSRLALFVRPASALNGRQLHAPLGSSVEKQRQRKQAMRGPAVKAWRGGCWKRLEQRTKVQTGSCCFCSEGLPRTKTGDAEFNAISRFFFSVFVNLSFGSSACAVEINLASVETPHCITIGHRAGPVAWRWALQKTA